MSETTESTAKGRIAAFIIAAGVIGGILTGVVVPNIVTQTHVTYGEWPDGFTAIRHCTEGDAWIGPELRAIARLPSAEEVGTPYCWYRVCYEKSFADALTGDEDSGQIIGVDKMNPVFAIREVDFQEGWKPVEVWCADPEVPGLCACSDSRQGAVVCMTQDGVTPAPKNVSLPVGEFTPGPGCLSTPCTVLAGVEGFNKHCCQPTCSGRTCGPDGCGGSCGECGSLLGPDAVTPVQLVCDPGAGRCCASPPCTPARTPFHPEWPEP